MANSRPNGRLARVVCILLTASVFARNSSLQVAATSFGGGAGVTFDNSHQQQWRSPFSGALHPSIDVPMQVSSNSQWRNPQEQQWRSRSPCLSNDSNTPTRATCARRVPIAATALFSKQTNRRASTSSRRIPLASTRVVVPIAQPFSYYARVALAGGLAGATGTSALYPIDSAKTLRQSNPSMYSSVRHAFLSLIKSGNRWHISKAYKGIIPAAVGAIPSSALYFGAYESVKTALQRAVPDYDNAPIVQRLGIHGTAAACGNMISSAVFVPKEFIKQQLQANAEKNMMATITSVVQEKGIRGLYSGYKATLLRNIPSAMLRFVLYEELKRQWGKRYESDDGATSTRRRLGLFAAGAVAGTLASGAMTPIDMIKTRLATGTCPAGVSSCLLHVVDEVGVRGLWTGAGSRMVFSGAFSAIGFGTFELVKDVLGVSDDQMKAKQQQQQANGGGDHDGGRSRTKQ